MQTTVDAIHDLTKRDSSRAQVIEKTQLAKEFGFKVMAHIMPDLPGTTPELDKAMIDDILHGGIRVRKHHADTLRSMFAMAFPCMLVTAAHALDSLLTAAALVVIGSLAVIALLEECFGYEYHHRERLYSRRDSMPALMILLRFVDPTTDAP